jgi:hypothetical protein
MSQFVAPIAIFLITLSPLIIPTAVAIFGALGTFRAKLAGGRTSRLALPRPALHPAV